MEKCYVIPTQNSCNADCKFCISKVRNYDKFPNMLEVDKTFTDNLHLLKNRGVNRFEITGGGEALLNRNIEGIVNAIKSIIPNSYIKLYTNGRILKNIHGINELNISVASLDSDINNRIMGNNDKLTLIEKLDWFRKYYPKIRLSVPIMKGGIDTKEKLDDLIKNTEVYVSEYVIRTLYPHSPNMDDYVNFEYERSNVIFERDNGVDDFDGIILWSDGKLYSDWTLTKERCLDSYMMLKPDSRTYINEIIDTILSEDFRITKILHFPNIKDRGLLFYSDKNSEYLELVKRHLDRTSYLFGDEGLILKLDKSVEYNTLLESTYELKKRIRNMYAFTEHEGGYLRVNDNISHLNLVHAPDPLRDNYERDIRYINNLHLRELNDEEIKFIKRYRTYNL